MVTAEPSEGTDPSDELDLAHLADLANLPLDAEEEDELAEACREVLSTFQLEEPGEEAEETGTVRTFDDEVRPWPEEGIEAILEAFPERDGRSLRP